MASNENLKTSFTAAQEPKTCKEAADIFRRWAEKGSTSYSERPHYLELATVLDAFGDQPVPDVLLKKYDFKS